MPGFPPEPTHLKILKGNPRKHRLPDNEAQPELGLPPCPPHLSEAAKKEWRRMGKLLAGVGLMSKVDGTALAGYCHYYALWVEAREQMEKRGPVVLGSKGQPMVNPFFRIANECFDRMAAMMREFGVTPAARTRVHAQQPKRVNKLDEFLKSA